MVRRKALIPVAAAFTLAMTAAACSSSPGAATSSGSGTLVVALTATTLPSLDTGFVQEDGYEGQRFIGNQIYDGLTRFDLSDPSKPAAVIPDLAQSWTVSPDATAYVFTLRPGITFQDGTRWDADAAMFNFNRYLIKTDPYYSATLSADYSADLSEIKSVQETGPMKIRITMKEPYPYLPFDLANLYFASPAALKTEGPSGFAAHPVGTGPFRFGSLNGQELTLLPNEHYWLGAPKLAALKLLPIPDSSARTAALRSGRVNWIEDVSPDDIATLGNGFRVTSNTTDAVWTWTFDESQAPWTNPLVRQAANYAINRQQIASDLLGGTADPLAQMLPKANPAYSASSFAYTYDPAKARALLTKAGYPHGVTATLGYPTSGSGMIEPGPINVALQQQLAAVGIRVTLYPLDFATILTQLDSGKMPWTAFNVAKSLQQFSTWSTYLFACGANLEHYCDHQADALLSQAQHTISGSARLALLTKAANLITRDAPELYVVSDRMPRAMSTDVHGFEQPQSWYIDLRDVTVGSGSSTSSG